MLNRLILPAADSASPFVRMTCMRPFQELTLRAELPATAVKSSEVGSQRSWDIASASSAPFFQGLSKEPTTEISRASTFGAAWGFAAFLDLGAWATTIVPRGGPVRPCERDCRKES